MRDRLIELLNECRGIEGIGMDLIEKQADHLLAEGVIVPPMALGKTCYKLCAYRNDIDECRVSSITQKADGTFKIRLTDLRSRCVFEIKPNEIGKTVFLAKEEAEAAIEERREG